MSPKLVNLYMDRSPWRELLANLIFHDLRSAADNRSLLVILSPIGADIPLILFNMDSLDNKRESPFKRK